MEISVVIPIYQRQLEGERALRSVLAQDAAFSEIIIVDDASPDPFVVPENVAGDPRIRLIRHEANLGESGARNTGIANARCAWIAFLDSDDYWLEGKLSAQRQFALCDQRNCPNTSAFYATGFIRANARHDTVEALLPSESRGPEDFASGCWFMPGSTVLFRKSLAEAAGTWDAQLRRSNDLDWYLRVGLAGGQLRVAPFVGSVIEIGARPTLDVVDTACRQLETKWIAPTSTLRLPKGMRKKLAAYLDIERAAAARASGHYWSMIKYGLRSLYRAPRARIHIRDWWRPTPLPRDWNPPSATNDLRNQDRNFTEAK